MLLGATAFSLVLRGLGGDELIEGALLSLPFGATGIVICILIATFHPGILPGLDRADPDHPAAGLAGGDRPRLRSGLVHRALCRLPADELPNAARWLRHLLSERVAPEGIDVRTIYRGVVPFILLQLLGLVILFNWEALVTWLPAQAYGA